MKKKQAYILFTDLDDTFTPITPSVLDKFANKMKDIKDKYGVDIKFVPVSGRNADYISCLMNFVDAAFQNVGITNSVDYGAGEHGAVIKIGSNPATRKYLVDKEELAKLREVKNIVLQSTFAKLLDVHPTNEFHCAFFIKPHIAKNMSWDEKKKLFMDFKNYMNKELKGSLNVVYSGCVEITPKGIGKDKAINWILSEYRKQYNIAGISYCGDSENDKKAIHYVSKLAEIPGWEVKTYLPVNAINDLESKFVEDWKYKNKEVRKIPSIFKASLERAEGIIELIEKDIQSNSIIGKGATKSYSQDDSALSSAKDKYSIISKLKRFASKDTQSIPVNDLTYKL